MGKPRYHYEDNDIYRLLQAGGNCYTDQAYRAAGHGSFIREWAAKMTALCQYSAQTRPVRGRDGICQRIKAAASLEQATR